MVKRPPKKPIKETGYLKTPRTIMVRTRTKKDMELHQYGLNKVLSY